MAVSLKNFQIFNTASFWLQIYGEAPKLCQKTTFIVMTSSMTSQGALYRIWRPYWMAVKLEVGIWLQENKPHSKLCQLQLFLRWWRHDNVMLGLWKFSDFCSRHTVGVAADAIMYHILVITRDSEGDNIFVLCVCLCVCVPDRDILLIHAWYASFGWLPQYDKGRFYTIIFT